MQGFTTLNYVGLIADLIGILGAAFALFAWRQARQIRQTQEAETARQNKLVRIVLSDNEGRSIELPAPLRRAELSRTEVLGRIGMIPMKEKQERFSLTYLNTEDFLTQLNEIIAGATDDVLTIPCEVKEFDQFNLST